MIVVGENLRQLMEQHKMVNRKDCYDENCIQLSLGESYIELCPANENQVLVYGEPIPQNVVKRKKISNGGLVIPPKTSVLACSAETVYMPQGYMGLLQTKGSLARLCVSLHFSDGQIDAGFKGKVTYEIFNASNFKICIHKFQKVGNLYIIKTSTKKHKMYQGRYASADGPTIQMPIQ